METVNTAKQYQSTCRNAAINAFIQQTRFTQLRYLCQYVPLQEAEDVLQEAYWKIVQHTEHCPDAQLLDTLLKLQPMLSVIAKNLALNVLRHEKVVLKHCEQQNSEFANHQQACSNVPESSMCERYEQQQLIKAINHLPPICRQVFVQRKIHEKSYQQIADMLHISKKTVENHVAKGLQLCRQYLQPASAQKQAKKKQIK